MRPGIRKNKREKRKNTSGNHKSKTKNHRTQSHLKHREGNKRGKEETAHPGFGTRKDEWDKLSLLSSNISRGLSGFDG
jgi:hypothetical protein